VLFTPFFLQEVLGKIHQTYRIQYLKDVILPRSLDDATYGTLSSLMLFNNVDVVLGLYQDQKFLPAVSGIWCMRGQHLQLCVSRLAPSNCMHLQEGMVHLLLTRPFRLQLPFVVFGASYRCTVFGCLLPCHFCYLAYLASLVLVCAALQLFEALKSRQPGDSDWDDLVAFLQEFCSLAKHLQLLQRQNLWNKMTQLGMFEVRARCAAHLAFVVVCRPACACVCMLVCCSSFMASVLSCKHTPITSEANSKQCAVLQTL
jgi:hypothetical protein